MISMTDKPILKCVSCNSILKDEERIKCQKCRNKEWNGTAKPNILIEAEIEDILLKAQDNLTDEEWSGKEVMQIAQLAAQAGYEKRDKMKELKYPFVHFQYEEPIMRIGVVANPDWKPIGLIAYKGEGSRVIEIICERSRDEATLITDEVMNARVEAARKEGALAEREKIKKILQKLDDNMKLAGYRKNGKPESEYRDGQFSIYDWLKRELKEQGVEI